MVLKWVQNTLYMDGPERSENPKSFSYGDFNAVYWEFSSMEVKVLYNPM